MDHYAVVFSSLRNAQAEVNDQLKWGAQNLKIARVHETP
jgi:hypothetical protein